MKEQVYVKFVEIVMVVVCWWWWWCVCGVCVCVCVVEGRMQTKLSKRLCISVFSGI